eukprot:gnl/Chilomastix_cuspidata/1985.p1 GENE.gnl/Chilomastix_cuspidata/1985~~gnl/Chilomastix_cuspidata/1985.p1  ORF type:complete len:709 (+),score=315.52 gnl/Chilomastix_cuspidata/1985:165-2129(+)
MQIAIVIMSPNNPLKKKALKLGPLVYPDRSHWLLVTLLLFNAIAMEALPIFLDELVSPTVAIIISVTGILVFGEVIPQAVCSRWGMQIGYYCRWLVWCLMIVSSPVSWTIGKVLDLLISHDGGAYFSRQELIRLLISHGSNRSNFNQIDYVQPGEIQVELASDVRKSYMATRVGTGVADELGAVPRRVLTDNVTRTLQKNARKAKEHEARRRRGEEKSATSAASSDALLKRRRRERRRQQDQDMSGSRVGSGHFEIDAECLSEFSSLLSNVESASTASEGDIGPIGLPTAEEFKVINRLIPERRRRQTDELKQKADAASTRASRRAPLLFGSETESASSAHTSSHSSSDTSDGSSAPSNQILSDDEVRIMVNTIVFKQLRVKDLPYRPLNKVTAISDQTPLSVEFLTSLYGGHTRIPVFRGDNAERIRGILVTHLLFGHFAAISKALAAGRPMTIAELHETNGHLLNPPLFVRDDTDLFSLFRYFLRGSSHFCFVHDGIILPSSPSERRLREVGQLVGIVTFEDLLERLIGKNIWDESDLAYKQLQTFVRTQRELGFDPAPQSAFLRLEPVRGVYCGDEVSVREGNIVRKGGLRGASFVGSQAAVPPDLPSEPEERSSSKEVDELHLIFEGRHEQLRVRVADQSEEEPLSSSVD